MIVEKDKYGIITCQVTSSTHARKVRTNVTLKNGIYYLKHNAFTDNIPVSIVFKGMGFVDELEHILMIGVDDFTMTEFYATALECHKKNICTQLEALEYIGKRVKQRAGTIQRPPVEAARDFLARIILAHVPVIEYNFKSKAVYMACMVRRVIQAKKDQNVVDDRDYYGNKRLELAGSLLSLLFDDLLQNFNKELKTRIDKKLKTPSKVSMPDAVNEMIAIKNTITLRLENAISTGNWKIERFKLERKGITEVLSRLSYLSALGMMTKINSQFEKTRKVSGPRSLQASQWGIICPSDTPEGESCGLVKNLALMAHITTEVDSQPLIELCYNCGVIEMDLLNGNDFSFPGTYVVFVNGNIIGVTESPQYLVDTFRLLRRNNYVNSFVSIYADSKHKNVHISSDGGRLCRPYIIVSDGVPRVTEKHIEKLRAGFMCFDDFLHQGLIEYLDVNEENDCYFAMYEKFIEQGTTHLEIEPFTILGVCAGLIPYPHHNQSPRNTYQCAMGKQAIGALGYNQRNRIDNLAYHLVYPQKPLVKTKTIELIGFEKLPAGHNAIVAVMSYSGYDIEDAVILNKASVDRGYGRCIVYKNMACVLKKHADGSVDEIGGPDYDHNNIKDRDHKALEDDGLPYVGTPVFPREVLINRRTRCAGVTSNGPSAFKNPSLIETIKNPVRHRGSGRVYIENVMMSVDKEDAKICKISYREVRRPEIGDKFSSRHGQKGVTGLIVNQEDMPFSESGMVPDMIMNPHGFPSRMTLGKQLEFMGSKAGAIEGKLNYGTAFGGTPLDDIKAELSAKGFNYQVKMLISYDNRKYSISSHHFNSVLTSCKLPYFSFMFSWVNISTSFIVCLFL